MSTREPGSLELALSSLSLVVLSAGIAVVTDTWTSAIIAFGINCFVFAVYGWPFHSEKFYDFTGMISFLSVDIVAFFYYKNTLNDIRSIITFCMPLIWTLRLGLYNYNSLFCCTQHLYNRHTVQCNACIPILVVFVFSYFIFFFFFVLFLFWGMPNVNIGTFLFQRILGENGRDIRFDPLRNKFFAFLICWILQGAWAYYCMLPILVIFNHANDKTGNINYNNNLNNVDYIGWCLWLFGFIFEVIADGQKSQFKQDKKNKGKFTNVGLWKISRHPNYFGEILLWIGLSIVACSVAKGWEWIMFLSPIWKIILLVGVSGIPPSKKAAKKKYGHLNTYQQYRKNTPILIPYCTFWK